MAEYNFGEVFARVLESEKERASREEQNQIGQQLQLLQLQTQIKENALGRELQVNLQKEQLESTEDLTKMREKGDEDRLTRSLKAQSDQTDKQIESSEKIARINKEVENRRFAEQQKLNLSNLQLSAYQLGIEVDPKTYEIKFPQSENKSVKLSDFAGLTQFDPNNFEYEFERASKRIEKSAGQKLNNIGPFTATGVQGGLGTTSGGISDVLKKQADVASEKKKGLYNYAKGQVEQATKTLESIGSIMDKTPKADQQALAQMLLGTYAAKYMDSPAQANEAGEVVQDAQSRYFTNLLSKLNVEGLDRKQVKELEDKINTTILLYGATSLKAGINRKPSSRPFPFSEEQGTINPQR